ncbi:DUF6328 family protein [Streptomyces sp. NPDC056492]|uniref:DUF6328 family protein n=1 Tax=unclassified Streptomyces TaxID=2593676 RepID=UPI0036965608
MSHGSDGAPYAEPGGDEAACKAYAEILQEVRIAQTAVQFLLGFLMAVAVTPRFAVFAAADRAVYVTALVLAFGSVGLLTAPAPLHRLVCDSMDKTRLVHIAGRLALWGVLLLMLAMSAAVLLVLSLVLSLSQAGLLAAVILCWLVGFWFAMPIWHRVRHTDLTPR